MRGGAMNEPSLYDLRADARLLCDFTGRKVAIYPNTSGQVVIACEDSEGVRYIEVLPEEVLTMCALLLRASGEAKEISNYLESQYETYVAIEHAKGSD